MAGLNWRGWVGWVLAAGLLANAVILNLRLKEAQRAKPLAVGWRERIGKLDPCTLVQVSFHRDFRVGVTADGREWGLVDDSLHVGDEIPKGDCQ